MFVQVAPAGSPVAAAAPEAAEAATGGAVPLRRARRIRWSSLTPYVYLLPAVVMLVVWVYSPLVQNFRLSFVDWNLIPTSPQTFVGLDNYATVLTLPELRQALANTGLYIVAFMVFSLVLPVAISLLARGVHGKAKTFYQALIFVPFLITPVATSAVWRWLFDENGGTIPRIAATLGWDLGNVFRDPAMVMGAVIVIVGWQLLGFGVLVVSAGIAGINPDYAAAASLDGASNWQITWRILLPLLSPSLVFLGLMTILLSAQWSYPIIDILTQGGPGGASTNIYYLLYQFGFRNFDAGLAAAAGTLFFLAFGLIAMLFVELSERLSFHDN